jgi:uridine kinase
MGSPLIVGITGGSGSGKTHFLIKLMKSLPEKSVTLFSMDNYYLPIERQEKDENGIENFDRPDSLDREKFHDDLVSLKKGEDIKIQEYTFNYLEKKPKIIHIKSAPIIIVEGIFTFYYEEISRLLDLKIYIDTPDYLMLKRRIIRDAEERGYDINDVMYRYEHHVTPAFKKYILPTKDEADIIIPNHDNFERALAVISGYLKQYI